MAYFQTHKSGYDIHPEYFFSMVFTLDTEAKEKSVVSCLNTKTDWHTQLNRISLGTTKDHEMLLEEILLRCVGVNRKVIHSCLVCLA